jgi:hypothetical protein
VGAAPADENNQFDVGDVVSEQRPGSTPEAGWYAYPDGGTELRWWSGASWTDHYAPIADATDADAESAAAAVDADAASASVEHSAALAYGPAGAQPATVATLAQPQPQPQREPQPEPQPEPEDQASNGYYRAHPVAAVNPGLGWGTVPVWFLAFSPWATMASLIAAFFVYVYSQDFALAWILVLLIPHAVTVGLAVLDERRLQERRHPSVPHWAWALLGAPAYLIARVVALRRSAIGGTAPLWVSLASVVLSWLFFFVGFFVVGALTLWAWQAVIDGLSS